MAKIVDIEGIGPACVQKLVRQVLSLDHVIDWISQPASLPRAITH
jgi:hypothetical protein